ncbi:MAG TPA: ABC transporter permease [Gemmatimonadaceae bacterium]|jgi:simple sugar transport system permease protein|nr:ABC transporter permease [Gemmatimonadaceae bacterium]
MMLLAFLAQTLRIAIPYLFAASGGVISERSGLIGLGLEGYMLGGAFCGAIAGYYSGNPWVGLLGALAGGALLALLYAVTAIRFRADQVVVGIAINLLVTGATRFFLRLFFHSSANSPRIPGFGNERSGTGFGALVANPLIWLGLLAVVLVAWLLYRTPFGLRVRAAGEHPAAAVSLGVPVDRVRYLAAAASGMLAALGGAYLALDQHQFSAEMTAGRGFIALAATIFGRWDPWRAALACLLFAAAETLQIQLQGAQAIPSQFVEMIPYALTIIALAGVVGRAVPPAALGKVAE